MKTNVLYKEVCVCLDELELMFECVCTSSSTMDLFCADQL